MDNVNFDIFNGDADGLCALHQLRLADPIESVLVTGVKRDIGLVQQVSAQSGDYLVVLDISFDKNREAIELALTQGASVVYYDHHYAGELPVNNNFSSFINTAAETCTSLIVNEQLQGKYVHWAITAAFGDNLHKQAIALAKQIGLNTLQTKQLEELGTLINYNGYGSTISDLYFPPDALYKIIHQYQSPFEFVQNEGAFLILKEGYESDLKAAQQVKADLDSEQYGIYILPNMAWAKRISGVYGNILTQQHPHRAHAVLTESDNENYVVSVRAPLENRTGADVLCRQFATGGGRKAAAGINQLAYSEYVTFVEKFKMQFT